MKICFIVGAYPTMKCGVGDYTSALSEEIAKNGNEVHVITSQKASNKSKNVVVHNIVNQWKLNSIKTIINELKEIKPDVVNIQYPSNEYFRNTVTLLPLIIKIIIKCNVMLTIHEYDYFNTKEVKSIKDKIRLYLNFCKVDKIITVEEKYIERIKQDYHKANISYIPISSNIPRSIASNDELNKIKKKFGLEDGKTISFFGFSTEAKGIEYLLKCMTKLDESIKLLYINELNPENSYHKTLLDLIDKLELKKRVIITGFYDSAEDIANLIQASDVCVLPFINGLKLSNGSFLAAYNQKIRIITTSQEDEKDKDGVYYVKPKNYEDLLNKIKYVLNDRKEFQREELTWEKVANSFINAIN